MAERIYFTIFANRGSAVSHMPAYAVRQPGEPPQHAVARSICRANGLSYMGVCSQGRVRERGVTEASHWSMSVGHMLPQSTGGGMAVEGEVWFSIEGI